MNEKKCPSCNGLGYTVRQTEIDLFGLIPLGTMTNRETCQRCGGSGHIEDTQG